jgi:multimeric flavodoxin WrbA
MSPSRRRDSPVIGAAAPGSISGGDHSPVKVPLPASLPVGNLLAFYGSPRKGGNTSILLDYFLEGVEGAGTPADVRAGSVPDSGAEPSGASRKAGFRIERIHLRDLALSPCTACGRCRETGVCVVQDDMIKYYDKLLSCDRIVMALPVFFFGPPAVAKAFIDRAQSLWIRNYALGVKPSRRSIGGGERKGFLLSVGGFKGSAKIFDCNRSIVKAFFMSCGVKYAGELLFPGVDHYGDIKNVEGALNEAREAGKNFAR